MTTRSTQRRSRGLRPTTATIRPSVQVWLESGDDSAMRKDNAWLLVGLKYGREAREAYVRGDVAEARRLLASCPAGHNFFVQG